MGQCLLVLSTCVDDWGGSEELILASVDSWVNQGYSLFYVKNEINNDHKKIQILRNKSVQLASLKPSRLDEILFSFRLRVLRNVAFEMSVYTLNLEKLLKKIKPNLVVINQGINFDGLAYSLVCNKLKIPYVLIVHKAVDFFWPYKQIRTSVKHMYAHALYSYFVSEQNRTLTEEQLGFELPRSIIVNNPIKNLNQYVSYPKVEYSFNFLCLGRFFLLDKGQDRLVRIFSKDKWKNRAVKLTLVGAGEDEDALRELIDFLGADNVTIRGWEDDIDSLWANYHILLAPSRSEGMTLSVLEAMAAGRPCVLTRAGGHAEIIDHRQNGFISDNAEEDFERVLEEAYQYRDTWKEIGEKARETILKRYDDRPVEVLAMHVLGLLKGG